MSQDDGMPVIEQEAVAALRGGGRVVDVYQHRGTPGGHNNDSIVLTMESGAQVEINAYSPGYMRVLVRP